MVSPYDICPDDTLCAACGKPLPENPEEGTVEFDGFCSNFCEHATKAKEHKLPFNVYIGMSAIRKARTPGFAAGPGFEECVLREVSYPAVADVQLVETNGALLFGPTHKSYVLWILYRNNSAFSQRLTRMTDHGLQPVTKSSEVAADPAHHQFSVLLKYPDYVASDSTYYAFVVATDAAQAIKVAQALALQDNDGTLDTDDPADFLPLLVTLGHNTDLNRED